MNFGQRHILHLSRKTCLENKFSSIFNKNIFSKKCKLTELSTQVSINNNTVGTNLPAESLGWAGQPIVKRVHPILPEIPGDIADTLKTVKELSRQEEVYQISKQNFEEAIIKEEVLSKESGNQSMETTMKILEDNHKHAKDVTHLEEIKNRVKSHDTISLLNEGKTKLNTEGAPNLLLKVTNTDNKDAIIKQNKPAKRNKPIKKYVQSGLPKRSIKPKYIVKKSKKIKKKTKMMSSKHDHKDNVDGFKQIEKSVSKVKFTKLNNKQRLSSQVLLNQRGYTLNAIPKGFLLMENRQFGTDCNSFPCKGGKGSGSDCAFPPCGKPGKRGKVSLKVTQDEEGKYPDDCKCPTTAENKSRVNTKICGEAKGIGKGKDRKKRKMKMCLVENKIRHRIRTFVCKSAAFEKGRKQKNLPKCPPLEKKVAARALICPPVLEDEAAKAKDICVKQIEEVKVRARTTVCKPIIIHAKAEVSLKIEKAVCVEKKTKRVVSRHTSICLPPTPKRNFTLISK